MNNTSIETPLDILPSIVAVDAPFDATDGAQTPFGKRWGGDVYSLTRQQMDILNAGGTLALDVSNEYVVFLQASTPTESNLHKT